MPCSCCTRGWGLSDHLRGGLSDTVDLGRSLSDTVDLVGEALDLREGVSNDVFLLHSGGGGFVR